AYRYTPRVMVQPALEISIIRGLKKRHSHAINYLFKRYYKPLCYFAARLTGDTTQAEDIAYKSLLTLWSAKQDFTSLSAIGAFLYARTLDACPLRPGLPALTGQYLYETMLRAEVLQQLLYEVETLPPVRRQIFRLAWLDRLSPAGIAERLQMTPDAVRVQKARTADALLTPVLRKGLEST
ncbi:MAG: hypothetical protein JST39_10180, partial [Bacteroidetes bacterium]|nr:hypothetical protein [Bacteroidota bacterium]